MFSSYLYKTICIDIDSHKYLFRLQIIKILCKKYSHLILNQCMQASALSMMSVQSCFVLNLFYIQILFGNPRREIVFQANLHSAKFRLRTKIRHFSAAVKQCPSEETRCQKVIFIARSYYILKNSRDFFPPVKEGAGAAGAADHLKASL